MADQPTTPPTAAPSAPAPAPEAGAGKPTVTFDEFAKLDLRVARVVAAENHPNADKLLKLQLDDGREPRARSGAGIKGSTAPRRWSGASSSSSPISPRGRSAARSRAECSSRRATCRRIAAAATGAERKVIVLRPDAEIATGSIVS